MKFTLRHVVVCLMCLSGSALAQTSDDSDNITRLLRAGQVDQAAARVESALSAKPRDPQLRFLRGVIQIEQKRTNDAIVTFQRMTEDFPELPEPYNNLAVLYAGQGQYDKSRAALELAIRTHPSYATAHENLGDVYTKMASESYSKALQLDASNSAAQVKLNLIRDLSTAKAQKPTPPPPVATAVVPAPVIAAVPAPTPPPAPVVAPPPVVQPPIAPPAAMQPPIAQPPITQPQAAPTQPALAAAKPSVAPAMRPDESKAAYEAVQDWAKAWSSKDVESYLASYSKSFATPNGESRKSWEAERRARIEGKRKISVAIESPTIEITGSASATVKFRQVYKADSLSANSRKTLKLSKADGTWKIVEETTGS